ncbi:MAG: arginine--tRNA ligase [Candidatus Roizmanbacteria bacterium]
MLTTRLEEIFTQAISGLKLDTHGVTFDLPTDLSHGDFTTNIAMRLSKNAQMNPFDLAQSIVKHIPANDLIEKVEAIKPGFINVFVKPTALLSSLDLQPSTHKPQRVCVEYTDPNPFKEFHIGHLYSNAVGESLARLQEALGHDVYRLCYQGDVGLHVACSVYGMIEGNIPQSSFLGEGGSADEAETEGVTFEHIKSLPPTDRVKWLGKCYAFGATANKENPEAAEKIKKLNAQLFQVAQEMWIKADPKFKAQIDYKQFVKEEVYPHDLVSEYYVTGRQWTLDYFDEIYKKLGTQSKKPDAAGAFDHYYFESAVAEYGYTTVMKYLEKGLFEKSDGAIVSTKDKNGLHTRVFINSHGLPTYEAKELGLNPEKYKKYAFDKSIIITANEINEYFKVLLWNLKQIDPYVGEHTTHIGHGVVRLPEGKMSSRTGKILSGESLIDEATSRVVEKMNLTSSSSAVIPDSDPGSSAERVSGHVQGNKSIIAQKVAIAAIKYSLLKTNLGKDVTFSFDESLSFEGNSGPYLLYTIVRCKSILGKSKVESLKSIKSESSQGSAEGGDMAISPNVTLSPTKGPNNYQLSTINYQLDDLRLLRLLARYDSVITQAADKLAPHTVCTYLYTLASEFSSYYARINILKTEDEALKQFRLWLVSKIDETLTKGVHILGFESVEKM